MSQLVICIEGDDVAPGTVAVGELVALVHDLDEAVRETAVVDHLGLERGQTLHLESVHSGSAVYTFSVHTAAMAAAAGLVRAIAEERYLALERAAHEAVERVWRRANRNQWSGVGFESRDGIDIVSGFLSAGEAVPPLSTRPVLTGETSVYGWLERLGGAEPRAVLKFPSGRRLSVRASRNLLRELAARLYTNVGLTGCAQWSAETMRLETFTATALAGYSGTGGYEALSALARLDGDRWRGVDALEYVSGLRQEVSS